MKADSDSHKTSLAAKAERQISSTLASYEPGDYSTLAQLGHSLITLDEFYKESFAGEHAGRVPELISYLGGKFDQCVVLLLKSDDKFYSYTPKDLAKFFRGEAVHGASDLSRDKRKVLHQYVFETDKITECEFQISWNFIVGPNLRAQTGNFDTDSAFLHVVNINGRRIEVSQIESAMLAIAYEMWQANTNGSPTESTKLFIKFNPDDYSSIWGDDLTERVRTSLTEYQNLSNFESDEDTSPDEPAGSGTSD